MIVNKFAKLSLSMFCASFIYAETVDLDVINVEDQIMKADKEVYSKAKAVSAREDIASSTQSLDTIIRTIPGAFTNQDKSTGTISPNIRGSSGLGRVNTMVDGITQTFYSSGTDDGRSGGTSQFGATIDPSFISGVDVERGSFNGRSGINSLMGSVNFRTLGLDDIIKDGKDFGFLTKYQVGNNAYRNNYMGALAGREKFQNGAQIGVMVGYGNRDVSQGYRAGGGIRIEEINKKELERLHQEYIQRQFFYHYNPWPKGQVRRICKYYPGVGNICVNRKGSGTPEEFIKDEELEKKWLENEVPQFDTKPYDPKKLRQKIRSNIAKFEYIDDSNILNLQVRNLEDKIWSRKIDGSTYQLNYTLSNGEKMDINFIAAYNETRQKYKKGTSISARELIADLETKNTSTTFDISDTFRNELGGTANMETTFGINNLRNSYSKNRHPYELVWFNDYAGILKTDKYEYQTMTPERRRQIYEQMLSGNFYGSALQNLFGRYEQAHDTPSVDGYRANTFQPSGKQRFFTLYADNAFEYDKFRLNLSINSVKYNYQGQYFKCVGQGGNCDGNEFMFTDYGRRKAINYSGVLSFEFHELFTPFVSYSKNERVPNIQELYFTQRTNNGFRNDLKNEKARTWQVGFNGLKEGTIQDKDLFGFKWVYYHTAIDDYIHTVSRPPYTVPGHELDDPVDPKYHKTYSSIEYNNYGKEVVKRGIEMEFSYDMGMFYANVAYARQHSNQPTSFTDASPEVYPAPTRRDFYQQGHGISKVTMLPKDYGFLDTGIRLFNEKLVLGGKVRYYGESKRAVYKDVGGRDRLIEGKEGNKNKHTQKFVRDTEIIDKQPYIFDFYVSYEPIKDLTIKAEVQNAFDKPYIDPLDTNNDAASQRTYSILNGENNVLNNFSRGRTAILSLSYKY